MTCRICGQPGAEFALHCGHVFHNSCLLEWSRSESELHAGCPVCCLTPCPTCSVHAGTRMSWKRRARRDAALGRVLHRMLADEAELKRVARAFRSFRASNAGALRAHSRKEAAAGRAREAVDACYEDLARIHPVAVLEKL